MSTMSSKTMAFRVSPKPVRIDLDGIPIASEIGRPSSKPDDGIFTSGMDGKNRFRLCERNFPLGADVFGEFRSVKSNTLK